MTAVIGLTPRATCYGPFKIIVLAWNNEKRVLSWPKCYVSLHPTIGVCLTKHISDTTHVREIFVVERWLWSQLMPKHCSRGNMNSSASNFCLEEEVWSCLKKRVFSIFGYFFSVQLFFDGMLIFYCRPLTTSNCAIHGGNLAHLPQLMNRPAQF